MSRWLKRIAIGLATLVVLIMVFGGFVMVKSSSMVSKKYPMVITPITVSKDSITMVRGEHFAKAIGKCVDCHGADFGGKIFIDDPALGQVVASNLTTGTGGIGAKYTDDQLASTIRTAVKVDSTTALVMPSDSYQNLSDEDVASIIAYLRAQPPVNRTLPKSQLRPVGRMLSAIGQLPIYMAEEVSPNRTHEKSVAPDTTVAYGSYIAAVGGCNGCHGAGLSGGKIPGVPPEWPAASNLTPTGLGKYTDEQVRTILTTGVRPDRTNVNPVMPWEYTKRMTADELTATIKYLRSVPAKEFGHR